jgi:hypothetical protein
MLCRLWDNVEKHGGAREATSNVTIWRTRVACWANKATHTRTHTEYITLFDFQGEKKALNIKRVFKFSLQSLSEIFHIPRIIQQDIIINVIGLQAKYPSFLSDF